MQRIRQAFKPAPLFPRTLFFISSSLTFDMKAGDETVSSHTLQIPFPYNSYNSTNYCDSIINREFTTLNNLLFIIFPSYTLFLFTWRHNSYPQEKRRKKNLVFQHYVVDISMITEKIRALIFMYRMKDSIQRKLLLDAVIWDPI